MEVNDMSELRMVLVRVMIARTRVRRMRREMREMSCGGEVVEEGTMGRSARLNIT